MIVNGFPNYEINILGEIKNLTTGRIKTLVPDSQTGYYKVILWGSNKYKSFNLHFLLASHFIPPVFGKTNVNHKNGIKTDNRIDNLEWCTHKENMHHSVNVLGNCLGVKQGNYIGAIHTEYGIFCTAKEAADMCGVSKRCMINWLNGMSPNKSKFVWSK